MSDLYREIILDHYKDPRNYGRLKSPTHQSSADNPLCGDQVTIYLKIKNGIIDDISFEAMSCAVTMATASLVTEQAKGKKIDKIITYELKDIQDLLGTELTSSRQQCALVVLEAIKKAYGKS